MKKFLFLCVALTAQFLPNLVSADGSETLGPPSIPIAVGTDIIAAGTGMYDQPGTINVEIPIGVEINQVLLYWEGFDTDDGDDSVTVNGEPVFGTLIGGPDLFFSGRYSSTYRADITSLDVIQPGANSLTIDDMGFNVVRNGKLANNGAGIMVIVDDGSKAGTLSLRDGDDVAWSGWGEPRKSTVPQAFDFPSATIDRTAKLSMFFGAVATQGLRPTVIEVTVNGIVYEYNNLLNSSDGTEWDTLVLDVPIPAGATSLTVQALSEDRGNTGLNPASFVWLAAGLTVPPADQPQPASLGDRVWQDLDRDGNQDCADTNGSGVIGDTIDGVADTDGMDPPGPCEPGIDGVEVKLTDCSGNQIGDSDFTSNGGFYRFDGLNSGEEYCVEFVQASAATQLGCEAVFSPSIGDLGVVDNSDANPATGETTGVVLADGEENLNVDAGLYCPPPTVSLGDRVWHDLNGDGSQNCEDTNGSGVIGDEINGVADTDGMDPPGPCEPGIDYVPVKLLDSCESANVLMETSTMNGGLYLFEGLDPNGSYCVEFGKPQADFCRVIIGDSYVNLGDPLFTLPNEGSDVVDSDADSDGKSGDISLSGTDDLTIDAGIICPVKIGNRVWEDDGDGIQQPGETNIDGVAVELFNCGPDGEFGTEDDYSEELFRTTEDGGMYMFGGEPAVGEDPGFSLNPGKYYVVFNPDSYPDGYSAALPSQGDEDVDSECMPEACIDLTASGAVNLDQDCGLIPPPPPSCDLVLDKTCSIAEETSDNLLCESAISATTLLYIGPDINDATVTFAGDKNGFAQYTGVDLVSGVTVLMLSDQNGFTIDSGDALGSKTEITINGALEIIHTSCSAVYSAGQPAPLDSGTPNPPNSDKGDPSPNWFVVNFRDKDGAFVSTPSDNGGDFADSCRFEQEPLPTCDNGEKPEMLTWRYDGGTGGDGDCVDSTFFTIVNEDGKLHEDFECTGSVDSSLPITVVDKDNVSYSLDPGDSFEVPRDSIDTMTLTDSNGATQDLVLHSSCSQPLEAQATAGAITLVALDDRRGGREVTYQYEVTNLGDELTGVSIVDIPLGNIVSGETLASSETKTYTETAFLIGTTTNTATASGMLATGAVCSPETATDSLTVTSFVPPCSVGVELYKVEDDKLKLKVTNTDSRDRRITIESLSVSFPVVREHVKELKLDGDFYKRDQANPTVDGTPASFGDVDWTNDDITNRQVKPGDTKTLEIVTTKKSDKNGRFVVEVTFAEGCSFTVVVENQQIVP